MNGHEDKSACGVPGVIRPSSREGPPQFMEGDMTAVYLVTTGEWLLN
jgi:hypothetical protein